MLVVVAATFPETDAKPPEAHCSDFVKIVFRLITTGRDMTKFGQRWGENMEA